MTKYIAIFEVEDDCNIKTSDGEVSYTYESNGTYYGMREGIEFAKEKTGWIPVNERLPEDFQRVLVTVVRYNGNNIVRVAEYYNRNNGKGVFQIKENHEEWEVGEKGLLAWMPLPAPFEPQESEDKE